jgi:hypothetical protein
LDKSATPTTATNSATYFVNSRLRVLAADEAVPKPALATGDPASVRPCGESGWREMLICSNLAATPAIVSCCRAGGLKS